MGKKLGAWKTNLHNQGIGGCIEITFNQKISTIIVKVKKKYLFFSSQNIVYYIILRLLFFQDC